MIKKFNTSIAYVCPYCSSITVKDLNIFSLSSESPNGFFCEDETGCGAVCISIQPKTATYEIIISCPICEDNHTYNIKKIRFWDSDKPIVLNCPETGIGTLFIGNRDAITKLVYEQENSIIQETSGYSIPQDLEIIFKTVEEINNLSKNDRMYCSCGSHSISISIESDTVILSCRNCGNIKCIKTDEKSLKELLKASAIVLD